MLIYQPVEVNCNVLRNSFVQGSVESDNLLLSIGTLVLFSIDVCCISNQHVQKFLRGSPYFCFFCVEILFIRRYSFRNTSAIEFDSCL